MEQPSDRHSGFVVCTRDRGCDDLTRSKIYPVIPDDDGTREGFLRVVDDSGEDYLYPTELFMDIQLPQAVEQALRLAS